MRIIIEGTKAEIARASRVIAMSFDAKKASKFYPNARGSITDDSGRTYIAINGFRSKDLPDILASDLLKLAAQHDRSGAESERLIRRFHESAGLDISAEQLFELYAALRDRFILNKEDA